jgi:calcium-translocating P-type ATPase
MTWHHLPKNSIFTKLNTSESGLKEENISELQQQHGKNKLPDAVKISLFKIIAHQIFNPLIYILLAAAVASMLIGEVEDSFFIFLVIFLNGALGTYQEYSAAKNASALRSFMKIKTQVKRSGKWVEMDAEELVPGDIVRLESGMKVPADVRLMEINQLEIEESLLTGESLPSVKNDIELPEDTLAGDQCNMAFAGSTVLKGRGWGVVVETGTHTKIGQIADQVATAESGKAPLVLRMEKFIRQISIAILVLGLFISFILRMNGMDWMSIFFFVVALAVSTIPEGLPVALTVALSVASKRMAKRNVIVRRLTAVESLGSCTVIASDKTGTLTVNQQTVKKIYLPSEKMIDVSGEGYNATGSLFINGQEISFQQDQDLLHILEVATLANEGSFTPKDNHWDFMGDSMDVALLAVAEKAKALKVFQSNDYTTIHLIPYESELRYSGAFYRFNQQVFAAMKGAVETVLEKCKLSEIEKTKIISEAEHLAENGFRVLAFARGTMPDDEQKYTVKHLENMDFCGLIGFIDPLRPEVKKAVKDSEIAGIRVIMITGDHPKTAAAIAKELDIYDETQMVVTGKNLAEADWKSPEFYQHFLEKNNVFARVSPQQKLQIVDALIEKGNFVAVTGDGVNDAPALRRANIGVAMGSGTDVAKETGDMIVVDDNFSSIVAGIEEGRFAYDNVRKVIYLLISTGMAEIVLFMVAILMGLPLPLLAVQLLWLNLVTNGIQDVALAFEGGEPSTMKLPPRSTKESIFNRKMLIQTVVSALFIGGTVSGYWYYLMDIGMNELHARNLVLLLMVFMQNIQVFNVRSERVSAFFVPISRNPVLIIGVLLAQGIHIASMQLPFMQKILKTEPITFDEWIAVLLLAAPLLLFMELYKIIVRKWGKNW